MKCPKCNVEMVTGIAIKPKYDSEFLSIVPLKKTLTAKEMKLIKCFKCPKCGHSDDGKGK